MSIFSALFGASKTPLALLRTDPGSACGTSSFIVRSTLSLPNPTVGGPCTVSCSKLDEEVYELNVSAGTGDFFFPYVFATDGGVGSCVVPIGQPDGTLALTGSMNGCALQVNRHGGNFYFYHDTNGQFIAQMAVPPPGHVMCRVENRSYAGPLNIGERVAVDVNRDVAGQRQAYFQHGIICVRTDGKWRVYVTGVHTFTKIATSGKILSTQLVKFVPTLTPCITSFDDA